MRKREKTAREMKTKCVGGYKRHGERVCVMKCERKVNDRKRKQKEYDNRRRKRTTGRRKVEGKK